MSILRLLLRGLKTAGKGGLLGAGLRAGWNAFDDDKKIEPKEKFEFTPFMSKALSRTASRTGYKEPGRSTIRGGPTASTGRKKDYLKLADAASDTKRIDQILRHNMLPRKEYAIGEKAKDQLRTQDLQLRDVSNVNPDIQFNFSLIGEKFDIIGEALVRSDERLFKFEKALNKRIKKTSEVSIKQTANITKLIDYRLDDIEREVRTFRDKSTYQSRELDKIRAELGHVRLKQRENEYEKGREKGPFGGKGIDPKIAAGGVAGAFLLPFLLGLLASKDGPLAEAAKKLRREAYGAKALISGGRTAAAGVQAGARAGAQGIRGAIQGGKTARAGKAFGDAMAGKKRLTKRAWKTLAKKNIAKASVAGSLKKFPWIGSAFRMGFAAERMWQGDYVGAFLETTGAALGLTGLGSLLNVGADVANLYRITYHDHYGIYPEADAMHSVRSGELSAAIAEVLEEEANALLDALNVFKGPGARAKELGGKASPVKKAESSIWSNLNPFKSPAERAKELRGEGVLGTKPSTKPSKTEETIEVKESLRIESTGGNLVLKTRKNIDLEAKEKLTLTAKTIELDADKIIIKGDRSALGGKTAPSYLGGPRMKEPNGPPAGTKEPYGPPAGGGYLGLGKGLAASGVAGTAATGTSSVRSTKTKQQPSYVDTKTQKDYDKLNKQGGYLGVGKGLSAHLPQQGLVQGLPPMTQMNPEMWQDLKRQSGGSSHFWENMNPNITPHGGGRGGGRKGLAGLFRSLTGRGGRGGGRSGSNGSGIGNRGGAATSSSSAAERKGVGQGLTAKYRGGSTGGVDKRLVDLVKRGSEYLPDGYTAKIMSGRAGRSGGGFHPRGGAADVQIFDEKGKKLDWYQNQKTFRTYEQFAQNLKKIQTEVYPGSNFAWGGYFWNKGPRRDGSLPYGFADSMHMQMGGGMLAGNWETGATRARGWLERGGGTSVGMGNIADFQAKQITPYGEYDSSQQGPQPQQGPTGETTRQGLVDGLPSPDAPQAPGASEMRRQFKRVPQRGGRNSMIQYRDGRGGGRGTTPPAGMQAPRREGGRPRRTGPPEGDPYGGRIDRSSLASELNNPHIRNKMARLARGEVGDNPEAHGQFIETLVNQAMAKGHSISQVMNSDYYAAMRKRSFKAPLSQNQQAYWNAKIDAVRDGQNVSGLMTDNASASLGARIQRNRSHEYQRGKWVGKGGDWRKGSELLYMKHGYKNDPKNFPRLEGDGRMALGGDPSSAPSPTAAPPPARFYARSPAMPSWSTGTGRQYDLATGGAMGYSIATGQWDKPASTLSHVGDIGAPFDPNVSWAQEATGAVPMDTGMGPERPQGAPQPGTAGFWGAGTQQQAPARMGFGQGLAASGAIGQQPQQPGFLARLGRAFGGVAGASRGAGVGPNLAAPTTPKKLPPPPIPRQAPPAHERPDGPTHTNEAQNGAIGPAKRIKSRQKNERGAMQQSDAPKTDAEKKGSTAAPSGPGEKTPPGDNVTPPIDGGRADSAPPQPGDDGSGAEKPCII